MGEPLVSIMMPTYRRPAYLRGALTAAVGQTYRNLQIVVRDNASGDQTAEVVRAFNDPRIEFHQSARTVSPSENGEECLRLAKGAYCMTLADDDSISANYVEVLSRILREDDDIAIAYAGGVFINEVGKETGEKKPDGSYALDTMSFLLAWCHVELPLVTPASMMLRTAWLREIASELGNDCFPQGHHSDTAFMIWVSLRGKVFFTDEACYRYRVHGGNTCVRLSSDQNLAGDKALLKFLERQRQSKASGRLTAREWDSFEKAARGQLIRTYYWRMMNRDFESWSGATFLSDLASKPARVYGLGRVLRALFARRSEIKSWLKARTKTLTGKTSHTLKAANGIDR